MSEPLATVDPKADVVESLSDIVEPEVVDAEPVEDDPLPHGTVAVRDTDRWVEPDKDWPHQWLDFEGDKLAVRKPLQQALAGYSLSASRYIDPQVQNDISGLFMARHMSQATYLHVMDRLGDPDDPDYSEKTVGELMKQIVELATNDMKEPNRADRRAAAKN